MLPRIALVAQFAEPVVSPGKDLFFVKCITNGLAQFLLVKRRRGDVESNQAQAGMRGRRVLDPLELAVDDLLGPLARGVFVEFVEQMARDAATALAFCHWFSAAAVVIPVCYYQFATRLTARDREREIVVGYAAAAVFMVLSFTPLIVRGVAPKLMFPFWPEPGPLYPAYLALFFYYLARIGLLLLAEYRRASFLRKNQLRYVLVYTLVGFIGGATNFLLWYDVPVPPVGNVLVALYMIGVGYAVIRFRLMEFDLLVARAAAYGAIIVAMAALAPLLLALVRVLGIPRASDPLVLFTAALVATSMLFWGIPSLRGWVDQLLEQRVLGERLANRAQLRSLATEISSLEDEESILRETVAKVAASLNVRQVAVFVRPEFETNFVRRVAVGYPDAAGALTRVDGQSPLVRLLEVTHRGVLLDEVEHDPLAVGRDYFRQLRRSAAIELVVPIYGDTFFYGFLALGARAPGALYSELDLSLLETLCLQIGLNIRARQLERQANQAEKLISLGTLAAGLAHELRNPLVSIQTFSGLLKERGHEPEFQQEFSAIMQRDVGRIASIVENVSAFAENSPVPFGPVKVEEVVAGVAEIVRPELARLGVQLAGLEGRNLPPVHGNYSQLLQVFLNLVQNALQALENQPGGRITFGIELRSGVVFKPMLYLSVSDNGPGIDPALLPRVFEPFTTTKSIGDRPGKRGLGLGLAIAKRIIVSHHGEIDVTSAVGRGTTFHVYLPCHQNP